MKRLVPISVCLWRQCSPRGPFSVPPGRPLQPRNLLQTPGFAMLSAVRRPTHSSGCWHCAFPATVPAPKACWRLSLTGFSRRRQNRSSPPGLPQFASCNNRTDQRDHLPARTWIPAAQPAFSPLHRRPKETWQLPLQAAPRQVLRQV